MCKWRRISKSPTFRNGSKEKKYILYIFPVKPKTFAKLLSKQVSFFIDEFLSKYTCGFLKDYGAQHYLLAIWGKGKQAIDNSQAFVAQLTDLLKAFVYLTHELLTVKLNAYGFSINASNWWTIVCPSGIKWQTISNESYSSSEQILFPVSQGSVLGIILFNIFPSDLFLVLDDIDIASYADGNSFYKTCRKLMLL